MSILSEFFNRSRARGQIEQLENKNLELARQFADQVKKKSKQLVKLDMQVGNLTRKDVGTWRRAWQAAINIEQPNRLALLDVYNDVLVDLHLTGCITQRKGRTLQKPFMLVNKNGKEDEKARAMFERAWFSDFIDLALDSVYFGHSLIQFGDIVVVNGVTSFAGVELVPRKHVVPEYGVITVEAGDDWKKGIPYREGDLASWCIEAGRPRDLGLLLDCAPPALSKKNMLAYWDAFGEIFGMPLRVARTVSQDPKDIDRLESSLTSAGAAQVVILQEGTEIEIKETTRGDAYNVYDRRVERCNSEIAKGVLGQTMTIEDGSSRSQSETHLEVFLNICRSDATMIKYLVNDKLIPLMITHGFPLQGVTFDWDEAASYTPSEQREIERLLLQEYEIDPAYFINKYKIPITGVKNQGAKGFFD